MDPERIAELLALMDPHEAVLILAALGEATGQLVAQQLQQQERERLIEVLRGAEGERWAE
jgi:Mg/Co/Ni transporter MgtE